MGRKRWIHGPAPVNIGGTGRVRTPRRRTENGGNGRGRSKDTDSRTRADGGRYVTGRLGEEIALEYLLQTGYKLIERNWRCRHKEVDLIMKGDDGLHIVEVRTMREPVLQEPEMTVRACKQHNLETAAVAWIRMTGEDAPVHFDIVSVVLDRGDTPAVLRLSHIRDAYFPMGR